MKLHVAAVILGLTMIGFGLSKPPAPTLALTGCTKQEAKTAIDMFTAGCIAANMFLADDLVMKVCNIEEKLAPDVKKLLAEQRKAAYAHVGVCGDAGIKDAGGQ